MIWKFTRTFLTSRCLCLRRWGFLGLLWVFFPVRIVWLFDFLTFNRALSLRVELISSRLLVYLHSLCTEGWLQIGLRSLRSWCVWFTVGDCFLSCCFQLWWSFGYLWLTVFGLVTVSIYRPVSFCSGRRAAYIERQPVRIFVLFFCLSLIVQGDTFADSYRRDFSVGLEVISTASASWLNLGVLFSV